MRPEDFCEDPREGAELASFAAQIGKTLRAEDQARDLSALAERVLVRVSVHMDRSLGTNLNMAPIAPWERYRPGTMLGDRNDRGLALHLTAFALPVPHVLYPDDSIAVAKFRRLNHDEALVSGRIDAAGMRPARFHGSVRIDTGVLDDVREQPEVNGPREP